jgi:hypothetical protein
MQARSAHGAAAATTGLSAAFSTGLSAILSGGLEAGSMDGGAAAASSGCGLRITGAGSGTAARLGRTNASRRFFASEAKLPFGYLSR